MIAYDSVERVLERVRPFLQADGGDLELVSIDGPTVELRLKGACAECPQAPMTLYLGLEAALREEQPDLRVRRVP